MNSQTPYPVVGFAFPLNWTPQDQYNFWGASLLWHRVALVTMLIYCVTWVLVLLSLIASVFSWNLPDPLWFRLSIANGLSALTMLFATWRRRVHATSQRRVWDTLNK